MLLHQVIEFAAGTSPDVDALVAGDRRWTFSELERDVARMGTTLAHVVARDERIAWFSDNRPELVMALYAVPRAGALLVLGNIRHTAAEQAAMLKASSASVVIGSAEQLARLTEHADELHDVRRWYCLDGVATHDGPVTDDGAELPSGTRDISELFAREPEPPRSGLDDDTHVWLIHTSGTTGRAKGALLTHRSLVAAATNTVLARPISDDDVYLFPFPLFHVAAYNVVVHHLGRRPVVLLPRFDPDEVLTAIRDESVTTVSLAPTMLAMLLEHPERSVEDLSSLRRIGYGASAMPLDLLRRTLSELPEVGLAQGYGMTELSGNAVFLDAEAHRRAAVDEPHLLSSCGKVGPLAAIRLADDGEILIRGDQVVPGYWDRPEANEAAFVDGWFRTGDIGRFDDEGYLYIVDRSKDIIVSGGENVASLEVEDVLSEHPDLAAVAVVGVPDERWGERVVLVAVARPGTDPSADGVMAWARGRLAGFKRPRQVLFVDELPTNASGKVLKREVRNLAAERLR